MSEAHGSRSPATNLAVCLTAAPDALVAGRTLREVSLPRGSPVVSGPGCDGLANADTELRPEVRYLVAAESAVVDEVRQLFRG